VEYIFNPEDKSRMGLNIVQPRPREVKLFEVAIYAPDPPIYPDPRDQLGQRNSAQLAAIRSLPQAACPVPIRPGEEPDETLRRMFGTSLEWAYRCYDVGLNNGVDIAGKHLFQQYIYLFNVLVAFEWQPSVHNIAMLERAARRAADFLFDVTNGWMSFGQIVIGGPELLSCADIQVMASNRLLPRSWVGGLHEEAKYMPIRLGRGLWQKNSRGSIQWDEPEGFRTLVHEWAHYALELLDAYVDTHEVYVRDDAAANLGANEARRSNQRLLVPRISQPVESIMATLEGTSELTAKLHANDRKQSEWDVLIHGFKGVDEKQTPRFPRIKGPIDDIEGPLPLPQLPHIAWLSLDGGMSAVQSTWADELLLPRASLPLYLQPEHCWVYVLKKGGEPAPKRLLAQGSLDRQVDEHFRLFGAEAEKGDDLVLIGNDARWRDRVLRATITDTEYLSPGRRKITGELNWQDVTPDPYPIITVQPEPVSWPVNGKVERAARLRVSAWNPDGTLSTAVRKLYLFPLDEVVSNGAGKIPAPIKLDNGGSTPDPVGLDGHVFADLGGELIIASYSQGGGPPTGSPTGGTPITPGSAEGNLMVFFDDLGEYPDYNKHHTRIRVVTTRWPGGTGGHPEQPAEPRSYAYTLCANEALPSEYLPTLILYYDRRAELQDGEAIIHRLDEKEGVWKQIISYRPSGGWYVAAPLNITTAPRLFDEPPAGGVRAEHFRLYWVPRGSVKPGMVGA
jgi:hypothetical protein